MSIIGIKMVVYVKTRANSDEWCSVQSSWLLIMAIFDTPSLVSYSDYEDS